MTCPHFEFSIRSRGHGHAPAVAGAAYISASKLFCEYDGHTKNFLKKQGELVHSEIILPEHAPPEFFNREKLWNSVDMNEKAKNAQLVRKVIMALPRELPMEENIRMVREFCQRNFVDEGMCCDFAIHDPSPPGHNPHAHLMLTMRAFDENGKWLPKSKKVYVLDKNGERIRLPSGQWKSRKEDLTGWNDRDNVRRWRDAWEEIQNRYLEENGRDERVCLKSFKEQGRDDEPTVHLGPAASAMERKGIETRVGEANREIRSANRLMKMIKNMIGGLAGWVVRVHDRMVEIREESELQEKEKQYDLDHLLLKEFRLRCAERRDWKTWKKPQLTAKDVQKVQGYMKFLEEHGIVTIDDLNDRLIELMEYRTDMKRNLKVQSGRINVINGLFRAYRDQQETRDIFYEFKGIRWKGRQKKFEAEHFEEIRKYRWSSKYLREHLDGKRFDEKTLKNELAHIRKAVDEENKILDGIKAELDQLESIEYFLKDVIPEIPVQEKSVKDYPANSVMKKLDDTKKMLAHERKAEPQNTERKSEDKLL